MKKIVFLCAVSICITSCSSYHSLINKMYNSGDSKIAISPDDSLNNDQKENRLSSDVPVVILKLKYKTATNEIEATTVTQWNSSPQGSIYLTWTAPKNSSCYSTSFPINKIHEKNDILVDSESIINNDKICVGTWIASLADKYNNSLLAKQEIVIKPRF